MVHLLARLEVVSLGQESKSTDNDEHRRDDQNSTSSRTRGNGTVSSDGVERFIISFCNLVSVIVAVLDTCGESVAPKEDVSYDKVVSPANVRSEELLDLRDQSRGGFRGFGNCRHDD